MDFKYFLTLYLIPSIFSTVMMTIDSSTIKHRNLSQEIEESGCPYRKDKQLLMKNVCLMPDYQLHEPPKNDVNGKTNVDVNFQTVPQLLEIHQKKNKITLQILQYIEWKDPRIRANLSAISNMLYYYSWIKVDPSIVKKIWHPNLDMYTDDLQDWKSLYHPYWFQFVGINKCPWLRGCHLIPNITTLYAEKSWTATLLCKFDFRRFPFDTQHCKFRQRFQSTSDVVKLFLFSPFASKWANNQTRDGKMDWIYTGEGVRVTITPIGTLTDPTTITQNSTGDFGFNITLQRISQAYLFQYYFPCAAIVVVSHISFVIPLTAIPGRVALVVTQFLTLTNIFIYEMVK